MATNKNITMNYFNGTDYDTLYPKTIAAQIDDVYSKSETYPRSQLYTQSQLYTKDQTLTDTTKSLFGLADTAGPNDVLAYLGQYVQYWWRRRTYAINTVFGSTQQTNVTKTTSSGQTQTIYYSDSITVGDDGISLSLTEPTSYVSFGYDYNYANANKLAGKYFIQKLEGGKDGGLFLASADGTASRSNDNTYYYVTIPAQKVTREKVIGEWEYFHSTNRNAYPDGGIYDGYEYEYLGIPFDNAVTAPSIATGSYVGTGTYGASNPCSLTFDFVPKFIAIEGGQESPMYANSNQVAYRSLAIFVNGYTGTKDTVYDSTFRNVVWNDNSVSWYNNSSSRYQQNEQNEVYYWIAIG